MSDETKNKDDGSKDLKKKLDAYVTVATHRLGRAPSLEELHKMLSDEETESEATNTPVASQSPRPGEPKQEVKAEGTAPKEDLQKEVVGSPIVEPALDKAEPRVLSMKVYYGMAPNGGKEGEERKPDPHKVLFYEHPGEGRVYSVEDQNWLDKRPSVLDHLPSRPLYSDEKDIVSAIANGVMEDDDYDALDKAGIIGDTPKRLWTLGKKLKDQVASLQVLGKSEEAEEGAVDPDLLPEGHGELKTKTGYDQAREATPEDGQEPAVSGDDHLQSMLQSAMATAMTGMENQIRAIVRDEIDQILNDSSDMEHEQEQYEDLDNEMLDSNDDSM